MNNKIIDCLELLGLNDCDKITINNLVNAKNKKIKVINGKSELNNLQINSINEAFDYLVKHMGFANYELSRKNLSISLNCDTFIQKKKKYILNIKEEQEKEKKRKEEEKRIRVLNDSKEEGIKRLEDFFASLDKEAYYNGDYQKINGIKNRGVSYIEASENTNSVVYVTNSFIDLMDKVETINELKKKKRRILFSIIAGTLTAVLILMVILNSTVFYPQYKYAKAYEMLQSGDCDGAYEQFSNINWKDSNELSHVSKAISSYTKGDIKTSINEFSSVDYKVVINYDSNGGESLTDTVVTNANYKLKDCSRSGYSLSSWTDIGWKCVIQEKHFYILVKANWDLNNYKIVFDFNGGSYSGEYIQSYNIEGEYELPIPNREGYQFIGWIINGNESLKSGEKLINHFGDINAVAHWSSKEYIISFDSKGGECETLTLPINYDDSIDLPVATKEGYTLLGWYDENDNLVNSEKYNYAKNTTFHAVWQPTNYELNIDLDGGSISPEYPSYYTIESQSITLNAPEREGYDFKGWSINESQNLVMAYTIKKGTIGNIKIKAIWKAKKYLVHFNSQNGNDINDMNVVFDSNVELPIPIREHYNFDGWYLEENYQTIVNNGKWEVASEITLFAKWSLINYAITYSLNGGSFKTTAPSTYTIETNGIVIPEPKKIGYLFDGWNINNSSEKVVNYTINNGTSGDLLLNANWQKRVYTISFDVNGGDELENTTKNVEYNSYVSYEIPTRKGYNFIGWYDESNNKYQNGYWKVDDDVTLTAKWEAKVIKVSFYTERGKKPSDMSITYDSEYDLPMAGSTISGTYIFRGWSYNGETIPISGIWDIDEDCTLTAVWQLNPWS